MRKAYPISKLQIVFATLAATNGSHKPLRGSFGPHANEEIHVSFPNPNCPRCHGNGELEIMTKDASGFLVAISYEPCPCTFQCVVEEEDWSDDRSPHLHSP